MNCSETKKISVSLIAAVVLALLASVCVFAEGEDGVVFEDGSYYYYTDGELQTAEGAVDWNGNRYYVTEGGVLATDQLVHIDGQYFYAGQDAVIKSDGGWITVDGEQYYLKPDGHVAVSEWIKDSKGWRLLDENGLLVKNQRVSYKGKEYYLKANTYMAVNTWVKEGSDWAYAGADGSLCRSKWIKTGSEWYYLNADTYMAVSQWVKSGSNWYWMGTSGEMAKNKWVQTGGKWYYLKSNGCMASGQWFRYNSKWYYLNTSGAMAANQWVKSDNKWYFLKTNGCMAAGEWIRSNGQWYYMKSDGSMAVSQWIREGNVFYWVNASGVYTTKHNAPAKAQSYASSTKYLILVDRSTHFVTVFQGSKGNWVLLMGFPCGDGKASTPTVTGEFSIPSKYPRSHPYFDSGSARCWYPTRIYSGYLFHSVLYYQTGSPSRILDGTLGRGVSHGCVRLALNNAKWIYDNIPIGTKVVIY